MTTPSKADIRAAIAEALKEAFGMTYIDPNSRPMTVLESLITTTLTQYNEALLAQLPAKRETRGPMIKAAPWHNTGFNEAIDQATAIIKRAGITGSGK